MGRGRRGRRGRAPPVHQPPGAPITTAGGETAPGSVGQGVKGPKSLPEGGRGLLCWGVTTVAVVSLSSQSHRRVQSDDAGAW